jgi:hypothetical protein
LSAGISQYTCLTPIVLQADTRIKGVDPATLECCAKAYEEHRAKNCTNEDMQDHYCMYVNAHEYSRITTVGVIIAILLSCVCAAVVVTRDIMKLYTPNNKVAPIPERQMTTMTAAYAGETMPVETESNEVKA